MEWDEIKEMAEGAVEELTQSEARKLFNTLRQAAKMQADKKLYDYMLSEEGHRALTSDKKADPEKGIGDYTEFNKQTYSMFFWNALLKRVG